MFSRLSKTLLNVSNRSQTAPLASRFLSTTPSAGVKVNPPSAITKEMAEGILGSTKLFMHHGLGIQRLQEVAKDSGNTDTLVARWQKMMEAFLGTQVHVLAGLGYEPNENGLQLYNQHLALFMQSADPETQENIRTVNRDLWRFVLCSTFDVPIEDIQKGEMSIVDARNAMHQVSQKMMEPSVMEGIAQKCAKIQSTGNSQIDSAQKHQIIQEALVHDVYFGGDPTLLETVGFDATEKGYVQMQSVMAEHQSDPLVAQYIGSAMMQIMKAAGIEMPQPPT